VSTNTGGIENVIIPNVTAFLTEVDDEVLFSEKMIELINNEKLRMRMGEQGWTQVGQKYHYERLTSDMRILYNKLLSN
jgi:glycosyltransferase involved in cell wall biosynthesis